MNRNELPVEYRNPYHPILSTIAYSHKECKDSRGRLFVTRTKSGWLFHCHNCAGDKRNGLSGFMPQEEDKSPMSTLRKLADVQKVELAKAHVGLPFDMTLDIPNEAEAWLAKYSISQEEMDNYMIGYSAKYDRLVLPIFNESQKILGWQGRCLRSDKIRPKYITYKNPSDQLHFDSRCTKKEYLPDETNQLVVVEDIISAIKVGRFTHTVAVLGSYINNQIITKGMNKKRISLWLDEDKWSESQAFSARFRGLGLRTVSLTSNKDPKEIPESAILSRLELDF